MLKSKSNILSFSPTAPTTFVHFTKRLTFVFIWIYPSYPARLFYFIIIIFTAADRARMVVVVVVTAAWCIAQHKDVIKGPNFQIMYSSHPVDRNRGFMGRHAGRLILICNPNWRLTNSFDLPLEARARSAKKLIRHNHLLLR